ESDPVSLSGNFAVHRIPTLSLYRGLLRNAATDNIRFRVRMMFRVNRRLTGTERTIKFLNLGYKWLDIFQRAKQGDEHYQSVLKRYSSLIAVKREEAYWMYLGHKEMAWNLKLRSRPIFTSIFHATTFNPHYPRLKPQPVAMSMIIKKRKAVAIKRFMRYTSLTEMKNYVQNEAACERKLMRKEKKGWKEVEPVFSNVDEWMEPITTSLKELEAAGKRGYERVVKPVPDWLKQAVRKARTERIANKTRELERERRGEILPRTIKRRRKGPPAHILAKMTAEEKEMDRVVRHRKMGMKMRDPDAWRVEVGCTRGEEGRRLKKLVEDVRTENERRRISTSKLDHDPEPLVQTIMLAGKLD
ncbi:hypothetical protein F5887DRAFT_926193, partial [Amanita rubescens]